MSDPVIRQMVPADCDWLVARHRDQYAREEGFDESFARLVGEIVDAFLAQHDPMVERAWIAEHLYDLNDEAYN